MSLNTLDIVIIMFILMGGIVGMKRGVIKQSVMTIGMLIVVILSFILKNPVSSLMYKYLPFFTFGGLLKDLTVLNIILYELIAFSIVFSILSAILVVLIRVSSIFERLLKFTIILAIPSKILGFILGTVEYYLVVFIILFIVSSPMFHIKDIDFVRESKLKDTVLNNTLGLSSMLNNTLETFNDIDILIKNKDKYSTDEFNCKAVNIMKENKFLGEKSLDYLYSKGKVNNKCKVSD